MNTLLNNKNIVVVGCGLLGAEISSSIVEAGGNCVISDISIENGKKTAEEIFSRFKKKVEVVGINITEKQSVLDMINNANQILNGIDALVLTAYPRNKNYGKSFEDVEYCDFCENIDLHLGGCFLVSQKMAEYFKNNRRKGNILNISSIYGVLAPRFEIYENTNMTTPVEYAAIKSAIIHLTKYMAKYYKNFNIRFNCVSPGGLLDNQPESFLSGYRNYALNKGMLNPSDIVGTIKFLLSDLSEYINGQNIIVDDGWSL